MTKNNKYQVNPLEKIAQIQDPKVRELCEITMKEAIAADTSSSNAINQRLDSLINVNVARLVKE